MKHIPATFDIVGVGGGAVASSSPVHTHMIPVNILGWWSGLVGGSKILHNLSIHSKCMGYSQYRGEGGVTLLLLSTTLLTLASGGGESDVPA